MLRLTLRSFFFYWRINLAIALGVLAATAVLTGALVVGDSVRGSLKHLTLDRLGQIDEVLVASRFFREELPQELAAKPEFAKHCTAAVPAIFLQATIENPTPDERARAGHVTVLGCDERFWKLGSGGPQHLHSGDEIVLNQPLADQVRAKIGDEVVLRIGQTSQIPADSPLGRKTETTRSRRLKVCDIIPAEGLGRFGLHPTQQLPYNAWTPPGVLQTMLEQPNKINAILVSCNKASGEEAPSEAVHDQLTKMLQPRLADYGYMVQHTKRGYFQLASDRMLLEPPVLKAGLKAMQQLEPQIAFTYLANWIKAGQFKDDNGPRIPYSTVTALDFSRQAALGEFKTPEGEKLTPPVDDEIILNSWAADDFAAQGIKLKPGDLVELTYFEPESTHGRVTESKHQFKFKGVVALAGAADDPEFTPELKGVTDEESVADWNPPFPYDPKRVRITPPDHNQDDEYWKKYRTTPKAFITLAAGRKLWASRFGEATSIRVAGRPEVTIDKLAADINGQISPDDLGLSFISVKRFGLLAAGGTTPFNLLFIGFSFFLIAAAVMLVALLFRLGLEQRAEEVGVLSSIGIKRSSVARLLMGEALIVTVLGGLVGAAAGVGYAWLMITGLKTWWLGAITTPFLELYVGKSSLIVGLASGTIISLLVIGWSLRRMRSLSVRQLLAGESQEPLGAKQRSPWTRRAMWIMVAGAIVLGAAATQLGGEAQAGAFFGSGALVLSALTLVWLQFGVRPAGSLSSASQFPLSQLAARSTARNPSRSTLTMGLVAAASFLIVAISAFRLDPTAEGIGRSSGSGGYELVAESDQPIFQDLSTRSGRGDLGFGEPAEKVLKDVTTVSLHMQGGDDASCLNLYQPMQPRVLGATAALVRHGGFAWAASGAKSLEQRANPWLLLEQDTQIGDDGVPIVPAVLDMNTALYSLHLWKGVGETFEIKDGRGEPVRLQVAGLLKNSIFQGDVIVSEKNFLGMFPEVSGYRMFLVDAGQDDQALHRDDEQLRKVRGALEETLGDFGFDAERSTDRLASFLAVQNTYLSTFQSLGGLGLLLGTLGLAAVQLRSVLERRGELALMRAAGYRRLRLAAMVMLENALLLVGGLAIGIAAALIAVLPHLFGGGASIPWWSLAGTLALVLIVGLTAGLSAVRATLRAPLLSALRGE